jgi:Sulfatase
MTDGNSRALLHRLGPSTRTMLARLLAPGVVFHLLMLAAFVAVFALIPLTVYMHSGEDWNFRPSLLLRIAALGMGLWLAGAVGLRLLAALRPKLATTAAIAAFCLGVYLLLAQVYAPVQIGPLDGSDLTSPEPLWYTAVDVGLLLVLLVVFIALARGRARRPAGAFALLLLVVTTSYGVWAALARTPDDVHLNPAAQGASQAPGNTYHFVLDAMQTDAAQEVLARRPDLAQAFGGFALFENNVSNYLSTRKSAASYFTSTLYEGDGYPRWQNSMRRRGLLESLAAAGYTIWMYVPFADWRDNPFAYGFWTHLDFYEREIGLAGTEFYDFLHIWLLGLVPTPLTNEALPQAGRLRDGLYRLLVGDTRPLSGPEGLHTYGGALMLRSLIETEARRPAQGQYVQVHVGLPHGPYVLDQDCRFVGRRFKSDDMPGRLRAYLDQSECALGLVAEFLRRLDELGRYDAATIVVQSDHGLGRGFFPQESAAPAAGEFLGMSRERLLSRVSALLMIKPAEARGALDTVATPSQLIDLLPTLVDLLDLPPPRYPMLGTSVFALDPDQRRHTIVGHDPENTHGPKVFDVRIEDPGNLPDSALSVLGPAGTWGRLQPGQVTAGAPPGAARLR